MKRILVTIATTLLAVASLAAKDYNVSTPNSMLVLTAEEGQPLELDGKIVSGRYLMDEGVVIKELTTESSRRTPYNDIRDMNDFRSCILELIAQ